MGMLCMVTKIHPRTGQAERSGQSPRRHNQALCGKIIAHHKSNPYRKEDQSLRHGHEGIQVIRKITITVRILLADGSVIEKTYVIPRLRPYLTMGYLSMYTA